MQLYASYCFALDGTQSAFLQLHAGLAHGFPYGFMKPRRQRRQRQAQPGFDQPHFRQRPFHRDGIALDEQLGMQAAHISCINRGATLAVTEITPCPPISISGSPATSSPL